MAVTLVASAGAAASMAAVGQPEEGEQSTDWAIARARLACCCCCCCSRWQASAAATAAAKKTWLPAAHCLAAGAQPLLALTCRGAVAKPPLQPAACEQHPRLCP